MPDASELAELSRIAHEAVDRASEMLRTRDPGDVTMKSDRNPATEVDYAIEQETREFLRNETPHIPFLGEEDGKYGPKDSDLVWTLDPIDGTVNFIHGLPLCGVSLGLLDEIQPVIGVVDLPFLGSRYSAIHEAGSYRDSVRLGAAPIASIDHAVVSLGDYAVGPDAEEKNSPRFELTRRLAGKVERIRMLGSAATDLVWTAEGLVTACIILSNNPWDTMAGVLIAREAGALVLDIHGQQHSVNSTSTVAVPPQLSTELIQLIRSAGEHERGT